MAGMNQEAAGGRPKGFRPDPFDYHQEVELRIDTLTNLGLGLGRLDGWVVMVPFSLPGEQVRARIFRNHTQYSEADLLEILEASPDRRSPGCSLFGTCGGCQYQHLDYARQLVWKTDQVRQLFQRIGGLSDPPVEPAHPSPRSYGYRSKLTPHWNPPDEQREIAEIGFLRFGKRRQLVDVEQCPIGTDAINTALPGARAELREAARRSRGKRRGGTLLLRHVNEGVVTDPGKVVSERVCGRHFQFQAGDFFQNNPFILPDLVDHVGRETEAGGVRFLVDAYCGSGLFAICLSSRFEKVTGVEINPSATRLAGKNAVLNGVQNVDFVAGEAEHIFREIRFPADVTSVIVDPPRKGCDETFLRQLFQFGPARVVYVSCDPSTQARDAKLFQANGYLLERVRPFDLFPQTRHIESVASFRRNPVA